MKRYPRRIDYCIIVIEFLFDTVRNGGYNIWIFIFLFLAYYFTRFFLHYIFLSILSVCFYGHISLFVCTISIFFFFIFFCVLVLFWFQLQPNIFLYFVDSESSASVCIHVKCTIVNDTLHESAFDIINSSSTILWIIFLLLVFWKDNNLFHVQCTD